MKNVMLMLLLVLSACSGPQLEVPETSDGLSIEAARILATSNLLEEWRPESGLYRVRIFDYYSNAECNSSSACPNIGLVFSFIGDGDFPDVSAEIFCCFSDLPRFEVLDLPRHVEADQQGRIKLIFSSNAGEEDRMLRFGYFSDEGEFLARLE
jgi:hypothetical protein